MRPYRSESGAEVGRSARSGDSEVCFDCVKSDLLGLAVPFFFVFCFFCFGDVVLFSSLRAAGLQIAGSARWRESLRLQIAGNARWRERRRWRVVLCYWKSALSRCTAVVHVDVFSPRLFGFYCHGHVHRHFQKWCFRTFDNNGWVNIRQVLCPPVAPFPPRPTPPVPSAQLYSTMSSV